MKNIIRVTGLIALAGAALFAVNLGSALAAPPPPYQVIPHDIQQLDPCVLTNTCDDGQLQPIHPCWLDGTCELQPIDPCMLLGNCSSGDTDDEDSSDEDMVIDPTVTPTDDPTATPTDNPTATPTNEPTVTPTTEPTDQPTSHPTDTPPTVVPPHAGDNGGIMNNVGGGVLLLTGLSLAAMALAWVMFIASRRMQTQR